MAEVKWIKIVTDIFDDEKILLIESMPEHDTIIVIWFKILTLAGKQNYSGLLMLNDRVHFTEEMLAAIFRRPLQTVRLALRTFEDLGMIEIIDDVVAIPKWEKHQALDKLEKANEQNRLRQKKWREKQKQLLLKNSNVTHNGEITQNNAIDIDKDKDKDIDKDISISADSPPASAEYKNDLKIISDFFQQEIGVLTPHQLEQLSDFINATKMETEVIKTAIIRAADAGKRSFGYVVSILRNWRQNGITTMVKVEEERRRFIEQKAQRHQQYQPTAPSNVPSWSNPEYKVEATAEDLAELEQLQKEIQENLKK